ncbi:MAG: hypothetical protein QOH63_1951 [Acidobacteriota bacterium]|jgi:hypothetical protein|nr:hypothetical protein [Acidobacteriota bacterium]
MKGLQEQTSAGTTFLVVKHNSICTESKTEREGYQPITVEHPRSKEKIAKFIKRYKSVEALVCKIEWYAREHEGTHYKGWKLYLDAAGVPCVLDLPFNSRAGNRFMKLAENLDFTQPIEFSAWYDAKGDATAFNVKQGGESVRQVYTRDDPGECPPPTQNKLGKWNFDAQEEFLLERMENVVIPAVQEAGNLMPQLEGAPADAELARMRKDFKQLDTKDEGIEDDEIPF